MFVAVWSSESLMKHYWLASIFMSGMEWMNSNGLWARVYILR